MIALVSMLRAAAAALDDDGMLLAAAAAAAPNSNYAEMLAPLQQERHTLLVFQPSCRLNFDPQFSHCIVRGKCEGSNISYRESEA